MFSSASLRIACIASGLGRVRRGLETWMGQLALHLGSQPDVRAEAWGGGLTSLPACPSRRIRLIHRDSVVLRGVPWHYRYHVEQMSAVIPVAWALRRRRVQIAFSADPSLAWNLKRLRKWHGAKVVFSDGMRLSPRWLQDYDGVHLLAPHYLKEARPLVRPERIDRFFVVPYFVDTQLFRPAPPELRAKVRARLGAVADTRVALTVGPVGTDSSKRLDHIAAELARTGDPRWLLLSVGGNEAGADAVRRRSLEALGDRVRFLGSLPREALPEIYQAADVYTLGALAEPFSIAILEALATGLPVIHHRYPVTEWITGDAGRAVDMTVDTAAAEAFQQFSLATEAGRTASAAALRLTAIRYTPEVVGRQLIRQFRALLGQGSSG